MLMTGTTECQKYCVYICIKKKCQNIRAINYVNKSIMILGHNEVLKTHLVISAPFTDKKLHV